MRKEKIVRVDGGPDNRDRGKHFKIIEMSAWDLEEWGRDAMILLAKAGVDIGTVSPEEGFVGILRAGVQNLFKLDGSMLAPLMDRMMLCVRYISDPKNPDFVQPLKREDVEELSTILFLRTEVMKLHQNFSMGEEELTPPSSTRQRTDQSSRVIRTRPMRSGRSSPQAGRP